MKQITYFAAGCFWHVQYVFDMIKGVVETEVGYMGGDEKKYPSPRDHEIYHEETGYAETIKVVFDDTKTTYSNLLNAFWNEHDPTSKNKQGNDIGSQYRAVIFYTSEKEKKMAEESLEMMKMRYAHKGKEVYTTVEPAKMFFRAEEYHQKFLERH